MGRVVSRKLIESTPEGSTEGLGYLHWCPGCKTHHYINVEKKNMWGAVWSFNRNLDKPTFNPSINLVGRCHYFLHDGRIAFCSDSTHQLAGQTVDLPDLPDWQLAIYDQP